MTDIRLVYVTVATHAEAEQIALTVVQERLAACANILGSIRSVYHWQGNLEQSDEVAMLLKTPEPLADSLVARVRQLHSYECPAILVLPVLAGFEGFLEWVRSETSQ